MVEENIDNLMPDAPQTEAKRQSFSNASSLETATYIWVRFAPKNELTSLVMMKWTN